MVFQQFARGEAARVLALRVGALEDVFPEGLGDGQCGVYWHWPSGAWHLDA